jgi:integrase
MLLPARRTVAAKKEDTMKGHVARKGNRWYAVIYEGTDPVTGKERRRWHAAGTERADAERLAARLARRADRANGAVRSLTFGTYLTTRWLPAKKGELRASTYAGYRRNLHRHVLPCVGRVPIRRLRDTHLNELYDRLLRPTDGRRALAPKTVLEIHLIIRAALAEALHGELVTRNVALLAHVPRPPSVRTPEPQAWTAEQLQAFLREAAGHRLFPGFWMLAFTGMRRSELLGLRWTDIDLQAGTVSINRGLVAVGYVLHESRGKTDNARRRIDLDPTTVSVLAAWRQWQQTEQLVVGGDEPDVVFTNADGEPVHPHSVSQAFERIVARAEVPAVRLHDLRHTHATLLIKAGVPVKVVSERLGHAKTAFTIETYQHVLPGMQADAARTFEQVVAERLLPTSNPPVEGREKRRRKTA